MEKQQYSSVSDAPPSYEEAIAAPSVPAPSLEDAAQGSFKPLDGQPQVGWVVPFLDNTSPSNLIFGDQQVSINNRVTDVERSTSPTIRSGRPPDCRIEHLLTWLALSLILTMVMFGIIYILIDKADANLPPFLAVGGAIFIIIRATGAQNATGEQHREPSSGQN